MTVAINKVGVIGSGQMGNGIAHVAALAGFDVVLNDVSADRLKSGMATINGNLSRQVAKKIITEDVRRCRYRCRYEEAGQGFASMPMLDAAAIDDHKRFKSRDLGAYLGLVPRRYQSGEVDYTGSISKCGDRRVRTLLYEAANVMLTRYKGPLKLKEWASAIARRSTMRKARIALARRLAIIMHAMLRHGTEFKPA